HPAGADDGNGLVVREWQDAVDGGVRGETAAGEGRGPAGVEILVVDQDVRVGDQDLRGEAAPREHADRSTGGAEVRGSAEAAAALAAADPWEDDAAVARTHALGVRPHRDDLTHDLVTEDGRVLETAVRDGEPRSSAQVIAAGVAVRVRVADPAVRDAQQDLSTRGGGGLDILLLQRRVGARGGEDPHATTPR